MLWIFAMKEQWFPRLQHAVRWHFQRQQKKHAFVDVSFHGRSRAPRNAVLSNHNAPKWFLPWFHHAAKKKNKFGSNVQIFLVPECIWTLCRCHYVFPVTCVAKPVLSSLTGQNFHFVHDPWCKTLQTGQNVCMANITRKNFSSYGLWYFLP